MNRKCIIEPEKLPEKGFENPRKDKTEYIILGFVQIEHRTMAILENPNTGNLIKEETYRLKMVNETELYHV